ncbi:hypothetical protein FB451DRAFT_1441438 [Mycena latifolia]|nr:hypothetical protein FB451DRAFT_1441438 [Mycena latifolia]
MDQDPPVVGGACNATNRDRGLRARDEPGTGCVTVTRWAWEPAIKAIKRTRLGPGLVAVGTINPPEEGKFAPLWSLNVQVASHPALFPHRQHSARCYKALAPPPAVMLPRTLARPQFTDVSRDALAAAAPELAAVPTEFIRHGLHAKALQMLAGIQALAPSHVPQALPRSHLPLALTVPLRASAGPAPPSYPTHALTIAAAPAKGSHLERDAPHAIFPVHAVVLAAHCAKLPHLLPMPPPAPSRAASATLPILLLTLPSPQAFAILHAFLYTHRLAPALAALLPLPPRSSSPSRMPRSPPRSTAPPRAMRSRPTCELWQDMVALSMYDAELWDALDLAWEVVLGALNLATQ